MVKVEQVSGNKPEPFHLTSGAEVEGMSSSLVKDVIDIVNKWGVVSEEEQNHKLFQSGAVGLDFEINISASIDPKNKMMFVAKSNMPLNGYHTINTSDGHHIFWDKDLRTSEARDIIQRLDDVARSTNLHDPKARSRIALPDEFSRVKENRGIYKVDEVFSEGAVYAIFPEMNLLKEALKFDEPDKLALVIEKQSGIVTIQKKDQVKSHLLRGQIARQVMAERGVTDKNIGNLEIPYILRLRQEIEDRTKEAEEHLEEVNIDQSLFEVKELSKVIRALQEQNLQ